jgi:hypothetical protein
MPNCLETILIPDPGRNFLATEIEVMNGGAGVLHLIEC